MSMSPYFPNSRLVGFVLASIAATTTNVHCFQFQPASSQTRITITRTEQASTIRHLSQNNDDDDDVNNTNNNARRQFLSKAALSIPFLASLPLPANAGIDVSSLRVEGGPPSNGVIASQLKGVSSSDNGTAASRVREIKQTTTSAVDQRKAAEVTAGQRPVLSKEELGSAAVYARVGGVSSMQSFGLSKVNSHYTGSVESPSGALLPVQFDFPNDWLRLDRVNGGIQYVDQRNGNKLYVLKAPLPSGTDLATVPKSFFDDAVFDEKSDLIRFGTVVGAHKTTRSSMTQDDAKAAYLHRRLQLNYETLAGNGVQTIERRGLLDAYEIEGYAYMMFASANAIKFDKKDSPERGTIDMIVDSFLLGQ